MCKYETKQTILLTIQNGHDSVHRRTGGRTRWNQYTVATQDWLLSHDRSSAVPRMAAAHWTTHEGPTTILWPNIVQHTLPGEDRPLWPITFDFRPWTDCRQNCLWKRTFIKLNYVMCKIWFCGRHLLLLHKDFSFWKTIMGQIIENCRRIGSGLNGVATCIDRRILSWRLKQPLLLRSFLQKLTCVDLNILTCCMHIRYACFISLQMVIKIQCFVPSHRSQDGIMKNPSG